MTASTEIFDKLAAPFPADAVHWRAQSVSSKGDSALALAYMDARDVMARLDETVGPANWQDSYEETAKGRVLCTLLLRIDGEWIAKSDGAGVTDVEGDKGAVSDALKRAAVKWGIGRYLYDMPATWVGCECWPEKNSKGKWVWKAWTSEGRRKLQQIAAKAPMPRTSEEDAGLGLIRQAIEGCDTQPALKSWWEQNWPVIKSAPYRDQAVAMKDARKSAIELMDRSTA